MRSFVLVALLSVGLAGCGSAGVATTSSNEPAVVQQPAPDPDLFSAERAFDRLEALAAIGPRVSGSEGAERAREFLRADLEALGLGVSEFETWREREGLEPTPLRHLSVTLPGRSPGVFLLVTPYDSSRLEGFVYPGVNDGASGAALLVELARVLSARSLPYTVRLLFLDGDGRAPGEGEVPPQGRWQGSASVARYLAASGELDGVRLLVVFHQVCDADLRIARDLHSDRMHREEFFRAADRIARTGAFPRDQGFESVEAGHLAFRALGVRSAVVITDTRYGGDAAPGIYAETAEDTLDHCAADSLEAVGAVTLEALDTIGRRLAKIERFSRSPVAAVESLVPEAESEVAPEAEAEAGSAADEPTPPEPGIPPAP